MELREEKCLLEFSETSLNVVGNDTIEKKKEHDSKSEAISLRRERGKENRRRIGLTWEVSFSEARLDTDVG